MLKRPPDRPLSILNRGFDLVMDRYMRWLLNDVWYQAHLPKNQADTPNPETPWLLVGNHATNWDGFLFRKIHARLRPDTLIYSVMLEQELKKLPGFRRMGAVGIEPGKKGSVIQLLNWLKSRRQRKPPFAVTFFPQGKLSAFHARPLEFKRGINAFASAMAPCWILPISTAPAFLSGMKPTLWLKAGKPFLYENGNVMESLERELTLLGDQQMQTMAEQGQSLNIPDAISLLHREKIT